MEIKLGNHRTHSYAQVLEEQHKGGKFVSYQWIIPLPLFMPVKRLSKVYFINKKSKNSKYALKYNIINLIIGWWGLPFGPIYLGKSIFLNNKGGIDVSEDIYLNINESEYSQGKVRLAQKAMKFIHPNKSDLKEFRKVFNQLHKNEVIADLPIIGYFIDTKKDERPYYLIGLKTEISDQLEKVISKAIYKKFYKNMKYQLINLNTDFLDKERFLNQGLELC